MSGPRAAGTTAPPRSYAAVGDSFSAGVEGDGFLPWPRRVLDELRAEWPALAFVPLARYGATSAEVLEQQLPRALAARPDLVTVSCGANDVLYRVLPDLEAFRANLERLLGGLRAGLPHARVLTVTYGDFPSFMPYRPRSRRRVATGVDAVNEALRELSVAAGCACVDMAASPLARRADSFGPDGIHASDLGHARTAAAVVAAVRGG